MIYVFKMVCCSAVLVALYHLFLEKEKMHQFNRFYLLFALVLSLLIPLVTFTTIEEVNSNSWAEQVVSQKQNTDYLSPAANITPVIATDKPFDYIGFIYYVGTAVCILRFGRNLWFMMTKVSASRVIPYERAKLILTNDQSVSHSFFNYIFINEAEYDSGRIRPEILRHELGHVRQKHSLDIILAEVLLCFLWFNPAFYLFKKAMVLNHEFIADDHVLQEFKDTERYQRLLLETVSRDSPLVLSSQFNYFITRKRLIMMTKKSRPITLMVKQITVLPLLAGCVLLFSTKVSARLSTKAETNVNEVRKLQAVTQETPEALQEAYNEILNTYKTTTVKGWKTFLNGVTKEDRQKLAVIYSRMKPDQQAKQGVVFVEPGKPFRKVLVTSAQLEKWKNANIYGVWVDGKRITNGELENYSGSNFSHQFVSKLSKNTINYGKHYYQVDLMTNAYYKNYYANAIANKEKLMLVNQNFGR